MCTSNQFGARGRMLNTGCGFAWGQLVPQPETSLGGAEGRPSWTSHQLQTGFVSACFSQPRFSPLWGEHHNAVDSDFLWGLKRSSAHCRLNKRRQTNGADQSAHILRKCLTSPQVFDGNSCVWGFSGSFPQHVELWDLVGFVCRSSPLLSSVSAWAQPGPCGVLRYFSLSICLSYNKRLTLCSLWWWREGENTKYRANNWWEHRPRLTSRPLHLLLYTCPPQTIVSSSLAYTGPEGWAPCWGAASPNRLSLAQLVSHKGIAQK